MRDLVLRIGLALIGVPALVVGAWAAFAPRSFYDDFPGTGSWIAPDGPYNEHLVRDVGQLNLALALVTAVAAVTLAALLVRTVLVAWLVTSVPHLVYHLGHLDPYERTDQVGIASSLALVPVLAVALLVVEWRTAPGRRTESTLDGPSPAVARAAGD